MWDDVPWAAPCGADFGPLFAAPLRAPPVVARGARLRVAVGDLRDVTMIDGTAEPVPDERTKDAFAAKHGWDPRRETRDYAYFRIVPGRVQAWREVNELPGRTLMRDGGWLA